MVEQSAVNRLVGGSNPSSRAILICPISGKIFGSSVLRFFGSSHFMVGVRLNRTKQQAFEPASVGNFSKDLYP